MIETDERPTPPVPARSLDLAFRASCSPRGDPLLHLRIHLHRFPVDLEVYGRQAATPPPPRPLQPASATACGSNSVTYPRSRALVLIPSRSCPDPPPPRMDGALRRTPDRLAILAVRPALLAGMEPSACSPRPPGSSCGRCPFPDHFVRPGQPDPRRRMPGDCGVTPLCRRSGAGARGHRHRHQADAGIFIVYFAVTSSGHGGEAAAAAACALPWLSWCSGPSASTGCIWCSTQAPEAGLLRQPVAAVGLERLHVGWLWTRSGSTRVRGLWRRPPRAAARSPAALVGSRLVISHLVAHGCGRPRSRALITWATH